ncbi:MAG: hypothetical protein A2289_15740 [Deltaproteobacteria bacterium RIFOXYA12_FULL_58_15]|nr:MAG: hypothetical protein A2289_15740 [Deltaproteobacteria bacterium RIFOXYA12_FULL_58_15]OGR10371.1 MAG: hypothetical protein A2341_22915 [Deltaproteobacteria bacterium RIFOXYB12_FULL_58_9]
MNTPPTRCKGNAAEVHDEEVRCRAMLYAKLGYPRARAEARLRANFEWEHDRLGKAAVLKRIPALVLDTYQRAGVELRKKR